MSEIITLYLVGMALMGTILILLMITGKQKEGFSKFRSFLMIIVLTLFWPITALLTLASALR